VGGGGGGFLSPPFFSSREAIHQGIFPFRRVTVEVSLLSFLPKKKGVPSFFFFFFLSLAHLIVPPFFVLKEKEIATPFLPPPFEEDERRDSLSPSFFPFPLTVSDVFFPPGFRTSPPFPFFLSWRRENPFLPQDRRSAILECPESPPFFLGEGAGFFSPPPRRKPPALTPFSPQKEKMKRRSLFPPFLPSGFPVPPFNRGCPSFSHGRSKEVSSLFSFRSPPLFPRKTSSPLLPDYEELTPSPLFIISAPLYNETFSPPPSLSKASFPSHTLPWLGWIFFSLSKDGSFPFFFRLPGWNPPEKFPLFLQSGFPPL